MKKIGILFMMTALISAAIIVSGFKLVNDRVGGVVLTEETIMGSSTACEGLSAGFRADSSEDLHWINSYDFSSGETVSSFKRGFMEVNEETSVYDDMRFVGWSVKPFCTMIEYGPLGDVASSRVQDFYQEIQERVLTSGIPEDGMVRLKDLLDYYPVSFRFQFGTKVYSSDDMLDGLKILDRMGKLKHENTLAYNSTMNLFVCFNEMFRIPVIDNEYHRYKVTKLDNYDKKTSLGYETDIVRVDEKNSDYYEFDPFIVLQEENVIDGIQWEHPDILSGYSYEAGEEVADTENRTAADYKLKNRLLFVVNNRTAKGEPVDVSQLPEGFGIYELPIEISPSATVRRGKRSEGMRNPLPHAEQLSMVCPLATEHEYVGLSLSGDHRCLAVFYVQEGRMNVELLDADLWESRGRFELFGSAQKISYAWGEDGSLAVTDNETNLAVLYRKGDGSYSELYGGRIGGDLIRAMFDGGTGWKENSYAAVNCGYEPGLAVAVQDGKAVLVQDLMVGDESRSIRVPALECVVIDSGGVLYQGMLKSDLCDLNYDLRGDELEKILRDEGIVGSLLIRPVENENWVKWGAA